MLRMGLQGFHGERTDAPTNREECPDPDRLEVRFERFRDEAA